MKVLHALAFGAAGVVALAATVPLYDSAQPRGLSVTRADVRRIADAQARVLGVPVEKAWIEMVREDSSILDRELEKSPRTRREVESDPVVGPRLAGFRVTYFRRGLEKYPEYGFVVVGRRGEVLAAQARLRAEEKGERPGEAALRARADSFVASRSFPGAPGAVFESVRPNVLQTRTDHAFRYLVPHRGPPEAVRFLLYVYFAGDRLTGWNLVEEYVDNRAFRYEMGGGLAANLGRMAASYGLLAVILAIFLKKYHAGEVGIGIGAWLFAGLAALLLLGNVLIAPLMGSGTNLGGTDAASTAAALVGFKFLFFDLPIASLVFLGWSVGESYARERWGARLASFDALLRRDPFNSTVGNSLLSGVLLGPAVAAAAFLVPLPALLSGAAWPTIGSVGRTVLGARGGPAWAVVEAATSAIYLPVVGILFGLAAAGQARRRKKASLLPAGFLLVAALGSAWEVAGPNIAPGGWAFALGFGAPVAAAAIFLAADLLASVVSLFIGSLLVGLLPLLLASEGSPRWGLVLAIALPAALFLALGAAGSATGRKVNYAYEDLAPHVRRIIERERVKAEIDAANRIQAALLPPADPVFSGTSIASHYGAATEIGGDYFDFLPLPDGRLGLAFGDVSGHGLSSGIVMAMAKAALLVQVGHDPTPSQVMHVLNETVRRTAPKRILMTFFFGILDPATGRLDFCSAGHLDPYVYRASEKRLEALSAWGFPLGVRRRESFPEQVAHLGPGDRLVLYSDGLIEAIDDAGDPFGFDRFEETVVKAGPGSPDDVRQALLSAVKKFTRNRPPEDDQTLVVLSVEADASAAGERAA